MKSWVFAHLLAMRQALRRFVQHPFASLFEVAVLGIAIALPAGLHLTVENTRAFAARFPAEPEISIFMQLDADRAATATIERRLKERPEVERIRVIPRADALAELRKSTGLAEVLDALASNPLPDALTVRLRSTDAEPLEALRSEISGWPRVALVQVDSGWARKVEAVIGFARTATLLLTVVLCAAVVAVSFNTVRLQMLNRRDEIDLAGLIGATHAHIRRPYLYFGVLQGLFGGAMALAIVAAAQAWLAHAMVAFSEAYGFTGAFETLLPAIALAILAGAGGLGFAAAWISASRQLWLNRIA